MGLDGTSWEDSYDLGLVAAAKARLHVLTGCSGGGKSALLSELRRRGVATVEEPGRQVVKEQLFIGGDALPWGNVGQFIELTVSRSINHMVLAARAGATTVFDRSIVDQLSGTEHYGMAPPAYLLNAAERLRYADKVFVLPPWPEIFRNDAERRHSFEEAVASYEHLLRTYARLGYRLIELPKLGVAQRADLLLAELAG